MADGLELVIGTDELKDAVSRMKRALQTSKIDSMLRTVTKDTGRRVKPILRKELPKQYNVKNKWINEDVKRPRMGREAGEIACIIPMQGEKFTIGGNHISARGGRRGWVQKGDKYTIRARILAGRKFTSKLPEKMENQGGNPPFRNLGARKLNNATFTRLTDERFPIASVKALAIPQMPLNRSANDVNERVTEAMADRIERYFEEDIFKPI